MPSSPLGVYKPLAMCVRKTIIDRLYISNEATLLSPVIFFAIWLCIRAGTRTTLIGRVPSPCSTSLSTSPSTTRRLRREVCTMSPGHTAGTEMGCPCQLPMHHSGKWSRLRMYSLRKRWRGSSQCHQIWRKEKPASTTPSWSMAPTLTGNYRKSEKFCVMKLSYGNFSCWKIYIGTTPYNANVISVHAFSYD